LADREALVSSGDSEDLLRETRKKIKASKRFRGILLSPAPIHRARKKTSPGTFEEGLWDLTDRFRKTAKRFSGEISRRS